MSPLGLRRLLRRSHRRLLVTLAMLMVAGAFVAHHDVPMDMHDMSLGLACVAVLAVGVTVAAGIALVFRPRTWSAAIDWAPGDTQPHQPRSIPARAGPLHLQLLVIRR